LEQESTAAALHFALFPRKTRDGGLQPTCREPVVSMMAFVVDIFSPHDGSIDLLLLSELFEPTADEGQEGIVGLSVSVAVILPNLQKACFAVYMHSWVDYF
jgi:hypothetical protein